MGKDIEFGLILPQGWLNDLSFNYDYIRRFAVEADRLGFSLWAYDHFIPYYIYKPLKGKPMLECFTLLASIASITNKAKIGQVVTCNSYRNPSLLAKMISTLDFISNGRTVLGIGAGWYEEEYLSYGYPFPNSRVRIDQLDEALVIIRSMLEEGESTFHGKYYNTSNALNYPKPIQDKVPIMVGGYGKMLLKVVAKHADIYNCPFASIDEYKDRLVILKEHCSSIGRDYNEIRHSLLIRVVIGRDEDDTRRKISIIKDHNESVEDYIAKSKEAIIGDVNHVYKALNEYTSIGVTHFILHVIPFEHKLESLKLLSEVCMQII